ncbi:hypothetical protein [Acidithrix sp. C25]|uniref:hypothetical protein n=1 Tax=Acidithrix sp. C25 TaxID=1671482 RepID=UPI00191B92E7|nr:hypothetical protein [Acidithrix sp. C25]
MYAEIQGAHSLFRGGVLGATFTFVASAVPVLSACVGIATRPWRRFELIVAAAVGAAISLLANLGLLSSMLFSASASREIGGAMTVVLIFLVAVVVPFFAVRLALDRNGWIVYASLAGLFLDLLLNASLLGWSISSLSVQTVVTSIDIIAAVVLPVVVVIRRSLKLERLVISLTLSLPVAIYIMIGISSAFWAGGRI